MAVAEGILLDGRTRRQASLWGDALRRLAKNRAALIGLFIICGLIFVAIFADVLAPYPYAQQNVTLQTINLPPSGDHWMGTDNLGRDLFSRMLVGSRISLIVGVLVQVVALIIGVPIGALAGYFGGLADTLLMRFTDIMYAFPDLLFVIILMTAFRGTPFATLWDGMLLIILAIGVVVWPTMGRLVRGQFLSLREKEFVEAARSVGSGGRRIVISHLLPNSIAPIIVAVTLGIPAAIMTEAILSFIGLGVQAPMCSWGSLIQDGYQWISSASHLVIFPGLSIAITMLSFTFLGDGLRDALDPWMKKT